MSSSSKTFYVGGMKKLFHQIAGLTLAASLFLAVGTGASQAQLRVFTQVLGQNLGQTLNQTLGQSAGQVVGQVVGQSVGQCLDNRAINAAVSSGQILALSQIAQSAGFNPQQSFNIRVCRINGQPYYLLDTLDAYGRTQNHILRATDGAPYIAG